VFIEKCGVVVVVVVATLDTTSFSVSLLKSASLHAVNVIVCIDCPFTVTVFAFLVISIVATRFFSWVAFRFVLICSRGFLVAVTTHASTSIFVLVPSLFTEKIVHLTAAVVSSV
jgi:hypothetical protein